MTTTQGLLFESTDGGESWTSSGREGFRGFDVAFTAPGKAYAAGIYFLYECPGYGWCTNAAMADWVRRIVPRAGADDLILCGSQYRIRVVVHGSAYAPTLSGLPNDTVVDVATDPTNDAIWYAGTEDNGVYRSENSGASWTACNEGLPSRQVLALDTDRVDSSVLYAATADAGIFKTTNAGAEWFPVGLPSMREASWLTVDLHNHSIVYAGTESGQLFVSQNAGLDWHMVYSFEPALRVSALAVDPLQAGTVYAGSHGGGVWKSSDYGEHWAAANTPNFAALGVGAFGYQPSAPNQMIAGVDMYIDSSYGSDYSDPVVYCTRGGLHVTSDGGQTWTDVSEQIGYDSVSAIVVSTEDPLTAYTGTRSRGIYKTTDGGANWTPANVGLPGLEVYVLSKDPATPGHLIAGLAGQGLARTTDGGVSWAAVPSTEAMGTVSSLEFAPSNQAVAYAGTVAAGVFKSTDGGQTWAPMPWTSQQGVVYSIAVSETDPNLLFVTCSDGLQVSADGGSSWERRASGIINRVIFGEDNDHLYGTFGYFQGSLGESIDGGRTWTEFTPRSDMLGYPNQMLRLNNDPPELLIATDTGLFLARVSWDLSVSKTHDGALTVGQPAVYRISVSNTGTVDYATTLSLTDDLPAGLTYLSSEGEGWTCAANTQAINCTKATGLAAGATSELVLRVQVGAGTSGEVTNTVRLAETDDATPLNNSNTDTAVVNHCPIAQAGTDRQTREGLVVKLDASGSSDPEVAPLSCQWRQLSGPVVLLQSADSPLATFVAPPFSAGIEPLEFELTVSDGSCSSTDTLVVTVLPARFADVPPADPFYPSVDRIAQLGITAGCSADSYCPDSNVTRAQMAVFLLKAMYGSTYTPPATTGLFSDVPSSHWAAAWIEQLYREGVTSGCGQGRFCPDAVISRAEMAVFIVKALDMTTYYAQLFDDVPWGHWAFAYIGAFAHAGITAGCGGGNYCPDSPVTRAQMAVFLCKAFGL